MAEQPGEKYAFLNLAKALSAESSKKIRQWRDVLAAMKAGDLTVGSRTPVAGMPKWATPEVVRGGFATTAFAAGGKLRPHEVAKAEELGLQTSDVSRARLALNNWHLTDEGLKKLSQQAAAAEFAAQTPEETALLTVCLLLEHDPDAAEEILAEITPFFDRLRFYPAPCAARKTDGAFVRSVQEIRDQLSGKVPREQIVVQHNTLTRWIPLYDRLIDLLAEHESEGWTIRVDDWCADYDQALTAPTAQRWKKPTGQLQRARRALLALRRGGDPNDNVETIIKRHRLKYGIAEERRAHRQSQAEQDVKVWHDAVAKIVAARLAKLPLDMGVADPSSVTGPIGPDEEVVGGPSGAQLPRSFERGIHSARMASIDELVEGGQIGASEVLAKVLPQITSSIYASGLPTEAEAEVCRTLYRAFSNRRSLLLLNLKSQVRLEELPWAQALLRRRDGEHDAKEIPLQALTELVRLSLTHFPHLIFPNTLIQEFSMLAKLADLEIPFTNEIAADIFMGAFSEQFAKAANVGLSYYAGTLYARYYDLPDQKRTLRLAEICAERAGVRKTRNWSVSSNGMIIEQQQIITTHNLAQVLSVLDLSDLRFEDMALRCFEWICWRQQTPLTDWRAKLQMTKNTAYAWRQMIAFMSELTPAEQGVAFESIESTAGNQSTEYQARFAPALAGLGRAISGETPSSDEVFLGWVQGIHPFAP
jgi:hypothetical protein